MAIKHTNVKAPGNKLNAVADWNADHTGTVDEAGISLSDVVTNDASAAKHGFLKRLDNIVTHFLRGDGTWAVPAGVPVPVGGIVAWAKSMTGVPALPAEFLECNGQVISDAGSPMNGQTLPNLNAYGGGAQRFLRGATTSGAVGGEDTHTLTIAEMPGHSHTIAIGSGTAVSMCGNKQSPYDWQQGTGSTGGDQPHENRPPYYEAVWVMRIK
jgi:microcystin-dependent protein